MHDKRQQFTQLRNSSRGLTSVVCNNNNTHINNRFSTDTSAPALIHGKMVLVFTIFHSFGDFFKQMKKMAQRLGYIVDKLSTILFLTLILIKWTRLWFIFLIITPYIAPPCKKITKCAICFFLDTLVALKFWINIVYFAIKLFRRLKTSLTPWTIASFVR